MRPPTLNNIPRTPTMHRARCRGGPLVNGNYTQGRSRSCAMPRLGKAGPQTEVIAEAGWRLFKSAPDALPCSQLSLSATEFADAPVAAGKSIARFFAAVPEGQQAEATSEAADPAGGVPPDPDAAGSHGGPAAGHKQQPKWERVKGTIAHSFARVPGASSARGGGASSDTGHCAHPATSEQAAQAADADHALPPDSMAEVPAGGALPAPAPDSASLGGAHNGALQQLSAAVDTVGRAAAEHAVLRDQPRSQSEPVTAGRPEWHSAASRLQQPMGRSRTATAAELSARRAAFASAADSAIAACMVSAQPTPQAGGGMSHPTACGGCGAHHPGSQDVNVAPVRSPEQSEPEQTLPGAASMADAIDLSSIDAREQDRILQEIARRQKSALPSVGGACGKRRSGGRGSGKAAKRTSHDPRQLCMERFMGSS